MCKSALNSLSLFLFKLQLVQSFENYRRLYCGSLDRQWWNRASIHNVKETRLGLSCVGGKECAQRAAVLLANGVNDLRVFTHVDFQLGLKNALCGILEFVKKNQQSPHMPMRR